MLLKENDGADAGGGLDGVVLLMPKENPLVTGAAGLSNENEGGAGATGLDVATSAGEPKLTNPLGDAPPSFFPAAAVVGSGPQSKLVVVAGAEPLEGLS